MLARYAIYMPWPCVCVRVCHKSESYRNGWVFGMGPVLHCVIRKLEHPKMRGLLSGTLFQTLDLENFSTASRYTSRYCQQNSSTVDLVDTYDG